MAEGKKTFIFYSDWINMVREMPDKEAGELLKHVLMYVNDEDPKTDNVLVKMAFAHMKPMLKKDLAKWDEIREKRKKAGSKGGKANAKQMLSKPKQLEAVNDNDNVNVDTKVSVYTEKEFLDRWKDARKYYLDQPTHISGLKFHQKETFKGLVKNYGKRHFEKAIQGLFENSTYLQTKVNPNHFLENFEQYLTAGITGEKLFENKSKKEKGGNKFGMI